MRTLQTARRIADRRLSRGLAAIGFVALWGGGSLSACGSSKHHPPPSPAVAPAPGRKLPAAKPPAARLAGRPLGRLPAPRSGSAGAAFGDRVVIIGGLSPAGVSTDTVFEISTTGTAATSVRLPGAVHDAAAASLDGRLLLFGGGQSEGSNRIIQVLPGTPRLVGVLPQALSDLDAVRIGRTAYLVGGWNGTETNRQIYAVNRAGTVSNVGSLPQGVRYPAAAALAGHVIVAGGETTSGEPTAAAWSFDPATRTVRAIPSLPAPTDHAAAAVLAGRVYVMGGLRRGSFTAAVVSWAPGERHWRSAGHLLAPVADSSVVAFANGIIVAGGRDGTGKLSDLTLMQPVQR